MNLDQLGKLPRSDTDRVDLYFTKFDKYQNGDVTVSQEVLNTALRRVQGAFKQPHTRTIRRMYQHLDSFMQIENNTQITYYQDRETYNLILDGLFVRVVQRVPMSKQQFPTLGKYSTVCNQRIRSVSCGDGSDVTVDFIEETAENSSTNNPIYYICVNFINKNNEITELCKKVVEIIKPLVN